MPTGLDRQYTVSLSEEEVTQVQRVAKFFGRSISPIDGKPLEGTFSEALRIAVRFGLEQINDRYGAAICDENQFAKVHESGHAVAYILARDDLNIPKPIINYVSVGGARGSGGVTARRDDHKPLTPEWHLRINVAGVVAEAKFRGLPFEELWQGEYASSDRRQVKGANIGPAVEFMTAQFAKPAIWHALKMIAGYLPNKGRKRGMVVENDYAFRLREFKAAMKSAE